MSNNTKPSWLSKDGQYYNTAWEKIAADTAWDEKMAVQQQQNKLLEEQNRLILQNQISQNKIREEQRKNHEEQIATIKDETIKQKKIAEESRILRLFDDIGLNKRYYDDYVSYLFGNYQKQLEDINLSIRNCKALSTWLVADIDENGAHNTRFDFDDCYIKKENKKLKECLKDINLLKELTDNDINGLSSEIMSIPYLPNNNLSNKELLPSLIDKYFNTYKKRKISGIITFISIAIIFILMMIDDGESMDIGFTIFMIVGFPIMIFYSIYLFKNLTSKSNIKDVINYEIKNSRKLDVKKAKKKLKDANKENDDYLKELQEKEQTLKQEMIKTTKLKWDDFVEFRKKHYLYNFEKLLLDMELDKKIKDIGLEYPKINKSNKISDGTIEDYVEYFDSLID